MKRTETVAEFLARGGKILSVPANVSAVKQDSIKSNSNNSGVAVIMSLEEADLFYGEHKARKAKKKVSASTKSAIDISALPEELRKKYIDEVIYAEENAEDDE